MNLKEWKAKTIEEVKQDVKSQLAEDFEFKPQFSTTLTEELFEEARDEWLVESFEEAVYFEEEFLFGEIYDENDIMEYYDFEPSANGEKMDIEVEVDLDEADISYLTLGKLRDAMMAEDYEVLEENDRKAKIVFKRAGGQVTKKKKCGQGMSLKGNKCIPQTGTDKAQNRKKGIKIKRAKKAMGGGLKKKAAIKAKITKKRVKNKTRNFSNTEN